MKHSAQGAAGPGAGTAAAAVRIPVQPSAADAARSLSRDRGQSRDASQDRGRTRGAGEPDGSARGEHTHGEPPAPGPFVPGPSVPGPSAPRPRALVQRSSVRGQVLDALRAALVTGELRPGEVYSAPVLGERFGVSATPVREAMQQLALEGAVEVVPNRGFRVVERGDRELAELAEVRALLEAPVWLRLARTVPAERWAELRPLAEATVRAASSGCPAGYAEADRAFHRAVLALAGNEELVRIAGDVHRRSQWPPAGAPAARGRADLVADAHEHTALLDALIAGDPDVVRALIGQHFTGALRDSWALGL
ncbi:GntR family transcriptional regulator [Streptomyces sp. CCM_MD2014]|uniref:GntR family transcriptional regulator n=1 Tax=Streptomyces sp. CCM_MD2014 TaxID=1561022 RepID=UPI00052A5B59|nr:GntR family transcriptional regulator [Streptomyces sp. CCM_MD2014]AIV33541.1 GntR family transcriptional regulator [Streptomyces sp. CCM_MD2014]